MSASFVDFADIKKSVRYEQVLTMLGIVVRTEGTNKLRGICPFCKDPRAFVVTIDAGRDGLGLGGCFKCGNRGLDSLGLVAKLKGIPKERMYEAAALIQDHFGLRKSTVSAPRNSTVPENSTVPTQAPQPTSQRKFDPDDYFAHLERAHPALEALGLQDETLAHFQAGYAKGGGNVGRLAVRVDDRQGNFVAFVGRTLKNESPLLKMPNGFDPEAHIFNAHRVDPGELYVVQDPLKVLTAFEADQRNVVSFLTDGISALQWQMLAALMDERQCIKSYLF